MLQDLELSFHWPRLIFSFSNLFFPGFDLTYPLFLSQVFYWYSCFATHNKMVGKWRKRQKQERSREMRDRKVVEDREKEKRRVVTKWELHSSTSSYLSVSCWPGLPGASLFLSSFSLTAGTAVQTQPIYSTSRCFAVSPTLQTPPWFPHQHQLPLSPYSQTTTGQNHQAFPFTLLWKQHCLWCQRAMRYGSEECSLLLPLCAEMMTEVEELQRAARD